MSDDEFAIGGEAHERLLAKINNLGNKVTSNKNLFKKKKLSKVSAKELVAAVHSTRNVESVKKDLDKKVKQTGKGLFNGTLHAPLHKFAKQRIESAVAFAEASKELKRWSSVVQKNRLAPQISFPLDDNDPIDQAVIEKKQNFKPRTSLETAMADILKTTKNNLGDEDMYTEAEKELIKAMSLKEAKEKCAKLQKMRALIGYHEVKLKRQAKIKSKAYHKHLKRQKRKQLIKEFDELLVKNPEAAKEKLEEIEKQRILERATLKHRNGSKRMQLFARYANKDTVAKKVLEEQIRYGRELTEKYNHSEQSDDEEDSGEEELTTQQLLEKAADVAFKENKQLQTSSTNPSLLNDLKKMRQQERRNGEQAALNAAKILDNTLPAATLTKTLTVEKPEWEEDNNWNYDVNAKKGSIIVDVETNDTDSTRTNTKVDKESGVITDKSQLFEDEAASLKLKQKSKGKIVKEKCNKKGIKKSRIERNEAKTVDVLKDSKDVSIDALFSKVDEAMYNSAVKMLEDIQAEEVFASGSVQEEVSVSRQFNRSENAKDDHQSSTFANQPGSDVDISLDPNRFLEVETKALTYVPADLIEKVDEFDANVQQQALIAQAFKDDDVIGAFEAEKMATEESEKEKDIDLNLVGWGRWTGDGIVDKRKERFIVKAKQKKRRDQGRFGVIISEGGDNSVEKVQPRSVPFPYTTVEDYEAVISQPIGKDWNPVNVFRDLVKPSVRTKSGRIIKPLDKENVLRDKVKQVSDDDE